MTNKLITLLLPLLGSTTWSQEQVIVNTGLLTIAPNTTMSFVNNFNNTDEANTKADGIMYYYANFNNDNLYEVNATTKTATTIFSQLEDNNTPQLISGNKPTNFNNVLVNSNVDKIAFNLKNELNIKGQFDFTKGIIKIDSLDGMITFHQGANTINASNTSFIDGGIEKIGKDSFEFPSGNKGFYRPAKISAPTNSNNIYESKYIYGDNDFFRVRKNLTGIINKLDESEFWILNQSFENKGENVVLTLSWDERTTPAELITSPEKNLHIVRWDENAKLWVDEGGVVDINTKEITTLTAVRGYGFFTLATIKPDWLLKGDVVVYNLVSANNDNSNDYFKIDNITSYPNNTVQIFNRWGAKVYDTSNYDSNNNVFKGFAEGKGVVNKGTQLPSGTYFYILNYEYSDNNGSQTIKTTGYLHLETN